MRDATRWWRAMTVLTLLLAIGSMSCSSDKGSTDKESHKAEEIGGHDCVACGMIVREQPAPRGQLVHRDRERVFFCSIGDLLVYLSAPSSHGKPTAIFVETLNPSTDPKTIDVAPRPWVDATTATYVVGVERPQTMGEPVLVYERADDAAKIAKSHGAKALDWTELQQHWAHAHAEHH